MKRSSFRRPKALLVFDEAGMLKHMSRSIRSNAEDTYSNAQSISFVCTGRHVSAGGQYYRHLHHNVDVTSEDLGSLSIQEYDKLCDAVRRYHPYSEMVRQRHIKNNKRVRKKCNCKCNCKKNNNNDE